MKKIVSLLLVVLLAFSLSTVVFAQDVGTAAEGTGSITINNAAKGETYAVYKLFDATINADGTAINYTGTIPSSLADYFTADNAGNISVTAAGKGTNEGELSEAAIAAIKTWTEGATAVASVESDGTVLKFLGLAYGYYVVTTSQGEANISVDSLKPNATIYDKNSTITIKEPAKTVDPIDYYIGDTITYTVSFGTANYHGEGAEAKKILSYVISDTLPDFLSDVEVTSIKIGGAAYTVDGAVPQFVSKTITIPWVDGDGAFLYDNGAEIVITYTAVLTSKATIDGNGNKNEVTITFTEEGDGQPDSETVDSTVYTYAIAIKKVDEEGKNLAGAVFTLPFYVKGTPDATDGAYIYGGTTAGEGLVNELTTPADGLIIIKGLKSGEAVSITEKAAPDGYNKLSGSISVTPVKTGATTTSVTTYFDENGNKVDQEVQEGFTVIVSIDEISATPVVVINKAGTELPSTGGIGTTIFYVLGGILAVGAAVVLIARKRVSE